MATRVLLVTQWFDPEPAFKGLLFAKQLKAQGFEVEVLTGFPNYPGGKVYPGHKIQWRKQEVMDGIPVTRVALYPSHDQSSLKRVFNYVSFAATSFLQGLWLARRADVIYAYHPPLTVGLSAGLIRLFRPVKLVYDIQDMWPDSLRATGMIRNPRLLGLVGRFCSWVYRRADRITVLSPGFRRLLIERGVPADKIQVIYNWCDEHALTNPSGQLPAAFPGPEQFRVLFAGNMGKAQALDAVLDAAALLQAKRSRVCFVMVGGGVEVARLKQRSAEMGLDNVMFVPPVPITEVGALLKAADVLLVHLRKDPLFQITIPSKTQAYMAVGKPVLMAVDGDAAELITLAGGGVVAESENAQSLADAAEALAALDAQVLADMGTKSEMYYRQHLSLGSGARQFGEVFRQLAA
jgi:colanic acid biosynthesis glycosyl transferase WcaI